MHNRYAFAAFAVFCTAWASCGPQARAAAILGLSVDGSNIVQVLPGDAFTLQVVLDAPDGVVHNSSLFSLVFTQSGLIYESYTWAAPYENQTIFDFSSPLWSALPAPIDPLLNPGPASEVVLSNVVPSGNFGNGVLVSLLLRVPDNWTEMTNIGIVALPDTFANGFEVVPVLSGDGVVVAVVPSGGGVGLLLCGGLALSARRRRTSSSVAKTFPDLGPRSTWSQVGFPVLNQRHESGLDVPEEANS